MPSCSVLTCNVRVADFSEDNGLRFHKFPTDDDLRKRWIESTGRRNWKPNKNSFICSKHFRDTDYFIKRSGQRYLKNGAIPCEYIVYANLFPEHFPVPSPDVAEEPEPVPVEHAACPEEKVDADLDDSSDSDDEIVGWDQLQDLVNCAEGLSNQNAAMNPAFREIKRYATKRKSHTRKAK
ncbi:THAP domain-containing protein 1-like isoform X2 [Trichoplusia ni]|uniref:THAP domain-containing protein 1-like isoform X2 n=1 Tax=Trichoplusia ni TaxID=7111 RepID=A0A7E5VJD1_TRINI|nr:THAP domain-containing protein 1-like isoform X2 [Trichoplusia ni]